MGLNRRDDAAIFASRPAGPGSEEEEGLEARSRAEGGRDCELAVEWGGEAELIYARLVVGGESGDEGVLCCIVLYGKACRDLAVRREPTVYNCEAPPHTPSSRS